MSQFIVHISNGIITNKKIVAAAFNCLPDGAYQVLIDLRRKVRSLKQNAYYHGIMVPMVREGLYDVGYYEIRTNEQAHEVLKMLFLKKQFVVEKTGEVLEMVGSTADLSSIEFIEFIEKVIVWAAENLGIGIPLPQEQLKFWYDSMEEEKPKENDKGKRKRSTQPGS